MRPNFHVNISEQFTISKSMRPSFEGSLNMEDVDEDNNLRKEVSCSKTSISVYETNNVIMKNDSVERDCWFKSEKFYRGTLQT